MCVLFGRSYIVLHDPNAGPSGLDGYRVGERFLYDGACGLRRVFCGAAHRAAHVPDRAPPVCAAPSAHRGTARPAHQGRQHDPHRCALRAHGQDGDRGGVQLRARRPPQQAPGAPAGARLSRRPSSVPVDAAFNPGVHVYSPTLPQ